MKTVIFQIFFKGTGSASCCSIALVFILMAAIASAQGLERQPDDVPRPDDPAGSHSFDTLRTNAIPVVSGLEDARSLVASPSGEFIITEAGAGRIRICTLEPGFLNAEKVEFSCSSTHYVTLPDAGRPDGLALVLDTFTGLTDGEHGTVKVLDDQYRTMRTLSVPSWVPGAGVFKPSDLTANEFGEIFVLDGSNRRLYHFNANGDYLQHFELSQTYRPNRLHYHNESLFISDPGSGNVIVLADSGRELARIGRFPNLERVIVRDDTIWVISGYVLHIFSITGTHLANKMPFRVDGIIRDLTWIENRMFLLTSGSLYFWDGFEQ